MHHLRAEPSGGQPAARGRAPAADPWARPGCLLSDVPFLLDGRRRQRMRGALSASLGTHILVFVLAVFLARVIPKSTPAPLLPDLHNYEIVWLTSVGPGGGGGGGGNEDPEPPRKVELPGEDHVTVPVQKPAQLSEAEPEEAPDTPPVPLMEIPAVAFASGEMPLPGVLAGLPPTLTTSQGSGVGGGGGTGRGTGIGPGEGSGLGPGWGGGTGGGAYRPGNGVTIPVVIREVKPQYTAEAMRAKIQGMVELEAIVRIDGTIGEMRIVRSLDPVFGLDEEAVKAVRQWRFLPGRRLGQPVPVLVGIELTFTLR